MLLYPRFKKVGVYCFISVCPSIRPSVLSCPSHEYFSSHFSQELHYEDFRNSSLNNFLFTEHLAYIIVQMTSMLKNFHQFLSGTTSCYITRISEIWFQGLYKSAIPWDAFSDSSLNNFLLKWTLTSFYTWRPSWKFSSHFSQELYITRISEIWFQGLYNSAIPCDAVSDSSLNNFLFTVKYLGGGIISEQKLTVSLVVVCEQNMTLVTGKGPLLT